MDPPVGDAATDHTSLSTVVIDHPLNLASQMAIINMSV